MNRTIAHFIEELSKVKSYEYIEFRLRFNLKFHNYLENKCPLVEKELLDQIENYRKHLLSKTNTY